MLGVLRDQDKPTARTRRRPGTTTTARPGVPHGGAERRRVPRTNFSSFPLPRDRGTDRVISMRTSQTGSRHPRPATDSLLDQHRRARAPAR